MEGKNGDAPQMSTEQMDQLMKKGSEAFTTHEYEKAGRLFLQAARADARNVDAELAYAIARFASGDYETSADAIRRGVKKYPDVANSRFDVRERYGNPEDFQHHLSHLEDYVLDKAGDPNGWIVLGFVRHFGGQRQQATGNFETIKKRFEPDSEIADIFLQAGNYSGTQPGQQPPQEQPPSVPPAEK
jgi:tetratricopeptide (TPR) repeat protein